MALVLALIRLAVVEVISLGFRTDVMLRGLEGSEVVDHADHVTVRTPGNPDFWWGNAGAIPSSSRHGRKL